MPPLGPGLKQKLRIATWQRFAIDQAAARFSSYVFAIIVVRPAGAAFRSGSLRKGKYGGTVFAFMNVVLFVHCFAFRLKSELLPVDVGLAVSAS
jgi:hypothetical protein